MLDLDRVKSYIELGFEKEDAIKRVEKEMKEEEKKATTKDHDDVDDKPNMDDYIKKDDLEEIVQKRLEEEKLREKEVDPPETKPDLGSLMGKFF